MKEQKYDVFVIGSGTAGKVVAKKCVDAGLTVAMADKREYGGTCANRGCDPKKVLLGATELLETSNQLLGKGIKSIPDLSWKKLMKFKENFTSPVPKATEEDLKDRGITLYHQSPEFLDEKTLSVEGKTVKADKIVIATGYEPRKLNFKGNKHLKASDDFLGQKKLPKNITFIGAGYVGMEFAHIAARAGAKVTVIDSGKRPLKPFDADLVKELTSYSKDLGIEFIFGAKITGVKKGSKNYKIAYDKKGKSEILKTRSVFNTAGRIPAIAKLKLENGNVAYGDNGIETNAYLQNKTNENVYACGDVADKGLPLTPLSGIEGSIVANNIIEGNKNEFDVPVTPSVVYTLPNLASVGYSEEEAKARYKNVIVNFESVPDWFNAKRVNAPVYAYKILLNQRTQEIVGAHLIGPEAGETINLFAMAINQGMTADQIKKTIFTYPSWSNDIKSMV
ncbi:dihydrolipoyl dehydrogenase family protein [Zobellia sp. B3R18]|uniref:dihydrolipoyl dehydrogenase family protein n=1 Tax=Zobellia sp. B3R18 TaxID=2841568 RepID=UPI001C07E8C4|nr:NAD(P)/FAD-dependent oxidoreductase [Zobellia sp. B3R18]MBU2975282.1 NAD(P)/FAD-dependent oxidoreductase [Zobellia sp. B3R18]